MAFEELKEQAETIQEQAQAYIESNIAYYKLWGFKVAMKSVTIFFKFALMLLCISMVLLFCSIAGAFAIGKVLESNTLGFLIVGAIYFVIAILLLFLKDTFFEGSILEKFSEIFFND